MWIDRIADRLRGLARGDMRRWYTSEGRVFFEKVGLREGQTVIDFGSRNGNYSIVAAMVAGESGRVYAIDKKRGVLKRLQRKAVSFDLINIETILSSGGVSIEKVDNSAEFVMAYDVLHMLDESERNALYKEVKRVLRYRGLFSVHPKHTISDIPDRYFKNMQLDDVRREIECAGFTLESTFRGTLSHRDSLSDGCVLNFNKE